MKYFQDTRAFKVKNICFSTNNNDIHNLQYDFTQNVFNILKCFQ